MFLFHIGFSLELIALTVGTALYVWGKRNNGAGTGLAKLIGFLVLLLSLIAVICTIYFNFKIWQEVRAGGPMGMMMQTQTTDQKPAAASTKPAAEKHKK